jgi:peptidoglycan-associated lipoprotein
MMASTVDDSAERAAREALERAALEAEREAARIRDVLQAGILFDFDMALLRDDARRVLDAKLPVLRNDPTIRLRIEGHADERGSTEYNIALGTRRATSVVNYLAGFGIDATRFQTLSYGEERPLMTGQDESAWAQNRRAEFVITAGALPGGGSRESP